MRILAGGCVDSSCPTIYATDRGTIVVQGSIVEKAADVTLAEGEALVEIPAELLREANV
jgi:hypothetical protein